MTLALGAAVLRYRLFDVDLIILRSAALRVRVGCWSWRSTPPSASSWDRRRTVVGLAGGRSDPRRGRGVPACPAIRAAGDLDKRFDRDGHAARLRVDAFLEATAVGHRAARPDPGRASGGAA